MVHSNGPCFRRTVLVHGPVHGPCFRGTQLGVWSGDETTVGVAQGGTTNVM